MGRVAPPLWDLLIDEDCNGVESPSVTDIEVIGPPKLHTLQPFCYLSGPSVHLVCYIFSDIRETKLTHMSFLICVCMALEEVEDEIPDHIGDSLALVGAETICIVKVPRTDISAIVPPLIFLVKDFKKILVIEVTEIISGDFLLCDKLAHCTKKLC